ncbi:hypothetical protein ACQCVO_25385, partial [Bacillus infantis]
LGIGCVVTSIISRIQGVAIFLLKKPSLIGFYSLFLIKVLTIRLEMKDYKYDYLLSGHFHGGQIHWPKPYHLAKMGKLVRMNMVKGLHYHNGMPFYISEGLGQTGVNIRIGSRPEITFHEIA